MPKCCFGACRGRGVPEALYTVKHCAQEVGGFQDATVFLQLDVSSAFDSLKLQAILAFFRSQWNASTGKSCKLLQWVLSHSLLRFQLFDTIWAIQQEVGTQQGATHSPTLFGRIVAHQFDDLCREWEAAREIPAFIVGDTSLWGIWFIDDTLCFFRNSAQFSRLVPKLISMLGGLGLRVNISKSCTMSCQGPPRQLTCLPALPHLAESTYLGHKLLLAEGDDHLLQGFLRRTSSAFFSNRPRPVRLQMFQALVTSSILWSLAVLSPTATHLRALRVQHVTLTGWMLRCAPHFSWRDPACIPCARHGVKLWLRCYSKLWDQLLLEQQWKWVGHVLRMPPTSVVRQTLLQLHPTSRDWGQRRARTGPNNAGHRVLLRWLLSQHVDYSVASDRLVWEELESKWVDRFCARHRNDMNLWMIPPTEHLPQDYRAIQGSFKGQQVFVVGYSSNGQWFLAELDRAQGCGT